MNDISRNDAIGPVQISICDPIEIDEPDAGVKFFRGVVIATLASLAVYALIALAVIYLWE